MFREIAKPGTNGLAALFVSIVVLALGRGAHHHRGK